MTTIVEELNGTLDYAELLDRIATWLHRTDLTLQIPDFVMLAESEINTELRTRLMESDEVLTLESGERTIALPDRYSEPIRLDLTFADRINETLLYVTQDQMRIDPAITSARQPHSWTVNGANIEFPCVADQNYSVLFRMLADFDIRTTSTNTLLTKYPGIYLYGSLLQAAPYCVNDARIAVWERMYEKLKAKVINKEMRSKKLARLITDMPGTLGGYNIRSDF